MPLLVEAGGAEGVQARGGGGGLLRGPHRLRRAEHAPRRAHLHALGERGARDAQPAHARATRRAASNFYASDSAVLAEADWAVVVLVLRWLSVVLLSETSM